MLCTRNLATNFDEVPKEWVWMYYCNLWNESFDGSTYVVHSLFRPEKTPSMKIFLKGSKYWFKDFSTGLYGDEINLVTYLLEKKTGKKLTYFQVILRILEEYNHWRLNNQECELKISDFKKQKVYKVSHKLRNWNTFDRNFWVQFNIGTRILTRYNVSPLEEFTLTTTEEDNQFTVKGEYIYGYFNNIGELVKIYQPKVAKRKFIYVKEYLQGEDQLQSYPYLMIQAGLKDIMSFASLDLKIDNVAPDSENTMISPPQMKKIIKEYPYVLVMLDNDETGHKSTLKYKDLYPSIIPVYHSFRDKKDTAEIVSYLRKKKSVEYFVPLIDRALCGRTTLAENSKQGILFV